MISIATSYNEGQPIVGAMLIVQHMVRDDGCYFLRRRRESNLTEKDASARKDLDDLTSIQLLWVRCQQQIKAQL